MKHQRNAFTIVELLLVVAIIAALISIVIYSLRPARDAGARTKTLNALRHMGRGYTEYATDNRMRFMCGYLRSENFNLVSPRARLADGTELDHRDLASYVWRLSPYLDHNWHTVMVDYHSTAIIEAFEREYTNGNYGPSTVEVDEHSDRLNIAVLPSFGINSMFLGGDDEHVLEDYVNGSPPWLNETYPRQAATHLSEVRFPSRVFVFAPSAIGPTSAGIDCRMSPYWKEREGLLRGYSTIMPPFIFASNDERTVWEKQMYQGVGHSIQALPPLATLRCETVGLPVLRLSTNLYPHANLDGSVGSQDINEFLVDMRRWSPFIGNEIPNLIFDDGCD